MASKKKAAARPKAGEKAKAGRAKPAAAPREQGRLDLRPTAAEREATAKKLGPVFYSVTIFVSRQEGERAAMLRHYEFNRDPVTFYPSEKAMREAQDAACLASFGRKR
jgi:hypothetical protein